MATQAPPDLPRWGGITEPVTVLTDVLLAIVAFVLTARLGLTAAAEGLKASGALAGGFFATSLAAAIGAVAHGVDPRVDPGLRQRMWRGALYMTAFISVGTVMPVAFFAARGIARTAIIGFALVKLLWYTVAVARRPEFRVAAADSGVAMAILLAGAVYAGVRWGEPGAPWLIGGVLVSLGGGVVQARRVSVHRHFNHNDLYHMIQIAALLLFYRAGTVLVDR